LQRLLKSQVDRLPEGPSEEKRRAGQAVLVGQARNDRGQTVRSRMRTPEGYSLTAATAFDAACRVVAGEIKPGFHRCRDKAVDRVMLGELISQLGVALRFVRHDVRLAVQIIADNL